MMAGETTRRNRVPRTVEARCKRARHSGDYRIVCGGSGAGGGRCPVSLGFAIYRGDGPVQWPELTIPEGVWYARQNDGTGFRMDSAGDYLTGTPRRIRRPSRRKSARHSSRTRAISVRIPTITRAILSDISLSCRSISFARSAAVGIGWRHHRASLARDLTAADKCANIAAIQLAGAVIAAIYIRIRQRGPARPPSVVHQARPHP